MVRWRRSRHSPSSSADRGRRGRRTGCLERRRGGTRASPCRPGAVNPRQVVIEVVMVLSEASGPAMAAWLAQATGATEAAVQHIERLGGGAIQENWALDIVCHGGQLDGEHRLVLRTDAPSRV